MTEEPSKPEQSDEELVEYYDRIQSEDYVTDPELMALADSSSRRESVLKPMLMLTVVLLGFWVISDWKEELQYFISGSEPVALGEAMEMGPDVEIPHNAFVSISGVPSRRSVAERYKFFTLIGTQIFVEQKRDDYIEDPLEREAKGNVGDVDRTRFRGSGRMLHFSQMSERYGGLRNYYQRRYGIRFCELLNEQQKEELRQTQRDVILQQYKSNYDAAAPEKRESRGLVEIPSDEQIKKIQDEEPICLDAYLLQADVEPADHLWYVIASALFLLFMVFNIVLLVRWIIRFLK